MYMSKSCKHSIDQTCEAFRSMPLKFHVTPEVSDVMINQETGYKRVPATLDLAEP